MTSYSIHTVKNKKRKTFLTDTPENALYIAIGELKEGKTVRMGELYDSLNARREGKAAKFAASCEFAALMKKCRV